MEERKKYDEIISDKINDINKKNKSSEIKTAIPVKNTLNTEQKINKEIEDLEKKNDLVSLTTLDLEDINKEVNLLNNKDNFKKNEEIKESSAEETNEKLNKTNINNELLNKEPKGNLIGGVKYIN